MKKKITAEVKSPSFSFNQPNDLKRYEMQGKTYFGTDAFEVLIVRFQK